MKQRVRPREHVPGDVSGANTARLPIIGQEEATARTARYEAVYNQSAGDFLAICAVRQQTLGLVDCQTELTIPLLTENRNHGASRIAERIGRLMRAAVSLCRQAYQLVAL